MPTVTLKLRVRPRPDVLNRIVSTCRQRRVEIIALSYTGRELSLSVSGDEERTRRIERRLAALVDVLEVTRAGGPQSAKRSGSSSSSRMVVRNSAASAP